MMEHDTVGTGQILFCRKCGKQLLSGSLFCSSCGAKVVMGETSQEQYQEELSAATAVSSSCFDEKAAPALENAEKDMAADHEIGIRKPRKKKGWKVLIGVLLAILLVCAAILIFPRMIPAKVEKQDINAIDGCPEFYNVNFGMTARQASALIEIEHEVIPGFESILDSADSIDSMIYLKDGVEFDLYGIPVFDAICHFDVLKIDSVLIIFSKEETSLHEVIELYTRIYGEPTEKGALSATWSGEKTTIHIFDSQLKLETDTEIIVQYDPTPNRQYTSLTFDGPEYDPCNFLSTGIFHKQPSYYTDGLTSGDDYDVEENDYFTKYTLYPRFDYMGIEDGMTAISFDVDASDTEIGVYSYLFLLEKSDAAERITYIKTVLEKEYGSYSSCTYTSMRYDGPGMVDLDFDEFISRIKNGTQGLYHIQWDMGSNKVTLNLTVDPKYTYYEGAVATSG